MLTKNKVKEKILSGEKVIGAFFNLGSPAVIEIIGQCGLDFIVIDTEHGPFDVETVSSLIMAAEIRGITPFVRVKDGQRNSILRMLDVGAMGLFVPFVKTVGEVLEIVNCGKYRPLGDRGLGFGRKSGYGMEPLVFGRIEDYFEWANENTLLIPQCETVEAVNEIEKIVGIDGVDGIFIGPYDLSVSMDIPRQFDHPEFTASIERVLKACKEAGKYAFTIGITPEDARQKFKQGFDGVLTSDISLLISGAIAYLSGTKRPGD